MAGDPTACDKCKRPAGPSCGLALPRGAEPGPCERCGGLTTVYSLCGVPRHYDCQAPAGTARGIAAARPAPDQSTLRAVLADIEEPRLTGEQINRAVRLWEATMRALPYTGPHTTALRLLNGVFSWPSVPVPPPWQPAWLDPLRSGPMWTARSWVVPDELAGHNEGFDLAAYDVNGMYLSAAATNLGTGAPEHLQWPADEILGLPGYARIGVLETAPYGLLRGWEPGMWMPTPLVRYLYDDGHQMLMTEALVWREHRRWLNPHVDLLRAARATLIDMVDPAARAVLDILKEVYTRMIGLVGSAKYNPGPGFNEQWHDMIPATGQARMFRGLDKVRHHQPHPTAVVVGVHADAAWYVMPRALAAPVGMEISRKLGKFKTAKRRDGAAQRVPWTADLYEAYQEDNHTTLRKTLAGQPIEATV